MSDLILCRHGSAVRFFFLRSEILDAIFMVGVAGSSSSLTGGAISTILFSVPSVVRLL